LNPDFPVQYAPARETAHDFQRSKMAKATFHWDDPLLLDGQLTSDEKMLRDAARDYAEGRLAPRVLEAFRHEQTDPEISARWEASGSWARPSRRNSAGRPQLRELWIDRPGSRACRLRFRSMMSVQSSLVMLRIYVWKRGSEAPLSAGARPRRLHRLLRPHGAQPWIRSGSMVTRARAASGGFRLSGAKTWITNSPLADVFVVWAKTEDEVIRGFILEKSFQGLSAPALHGKVGLRPPPRGRS